LGERRQNDSSERELLLLAEVAHLYYIKNLTQQHIAERIGVSRSKVSRLLREARARGVVEIRVHSPLTLATDLQDALKLRLGLRECLVLAAPEAGIDASEGSDTVGRLSALGARYLQENVADGSVVGVSWSSAVYHVVGARYLQEKSNVTAVQLMGSIGGSIAELDGVSITARLADAWGAKAHYLHAPMLVADAVVRDGLLRDLHIKRTLEVARSADTMVVSVGAIDRNSGQYRTGYLDDADLDYIREQEAVGDICGSYFSYDGSPVPLRMNERTIALGFEDLKGIPNRIGVSGGMHKVRPNIGAARAGLINVLITDHDTARQMLGILRSEDTVASSGDRRV
jgi:DNA-binding transcriptional regulator LsrR (DeoR family)